MEPHKCVRRDSEASFLCLLSTCVRTQWENSHLQAGKQTPPDTRGASTLIQNYEKPMFVCLRFCLFIFRESGREGEREGEKQQCVVASCAPLTGDLACNPGVCPVQESNQRPFVSQASPRSTNPHQPELDHWFLTFNNTLSQMKSYSEPWDKQKPHFMVLRRVCRSLLLLLFFYICEHRGTRSLRASWNTVWKPLACNANPHFHLSQWNPLKLESLNEEEVAQVNVTSWRQKWSTKKWEVMGALFWSRDIIRGRTV